MNREDLAYVFDFILTLFRIMTGLIKGEDISNDVKSLFIFKKEDE